MIEGEKWFSSNARYASFFIVMAVTNPDVSAYQGMSMFIVPAETAGVEIIRNVPLLLQILFWYFAVFLTMPGPRAAHSFADTFIVSSRGLNMPAALMAEQAQAQFANSAFSLTNLTR